jgi:hypothetical protein
VKNHVRGAVAPRFGDCRTTARKRRAQLTRTRRAACFPLSLLPPFVTIVLRGIVDVIATHCSTLKMERVAVLARYVPKQLYKLRK